MTVERFALDIASHGGRPEAIGRACCDMSPAFKKHWDGILSGFDSELTHAFLQGMNSLLQAAKSRAHGYRTTRKLITMAYLIGGKLNIALPT